MNPQSACTDCAALRSLLEELLVAKAHKHHSNSVQLPDSSLNSSNVENKTEATRISPAARDSSPTSGISSFHLTDQRAVSPSRHYSVTTEIKPVTTGDFNEKLCPVIRDIELKRDGPGPVARAARSTSRGRARNRSSSHNSKNSTVTTAKDNLGEARPTVSEAPDQSFPWTCNHHDPLEVAKGRCDYACSVLATQARAQHARHHPQCPAASSAFSGASSKTPETSKKPSGDWTLGDWKDFQDMLNLGKTTRLDVLEALKNLLKAEYESRAIKNGYFAEPFYEFKHDIPNSHFQFPARSTRPEEKQAATTASYSDLMWADPFMRREENKKDVKEKKAKGQDEDAKSEESEYVIIETKKD